MELQELVEERESDEKLDRALRPQFFDDYIGQSFLIEKLKISIQAAMERDEPIDSIALFGPPGLGKSSIAQVIANEAGVPIRTITAPSIRTSGDLVEILVKLDKRDILFLDEIHALNVKFSEILYPAIEDFKIDVKLGNKEIISIPLNPFTLIGATTQPGKMQAPLRDRFGTLYTMTFYSQEEISSILLANVHKLEMDIDDESCILNIAKRSRGVPRIANKLLRRIRDYAQVKNQSRVTNNIVDEALLLEGIDQAGLSNMDRKYLITLYNVFKCGPAGIEALASVLCEDSSTLADFCESFLTRSGYIIRGKTGRLLTGFGMRYLVDNKYV